MAESVGLRATLLARLPALESRDFTLLWLGLGVSSLGTQVQRVAVAWQLYLLTRDPLSLGLLGLFRVLPILLLALGAGVVADAVDRRRLMLFTQTLLASSSVLLAALTSTGGITPAAIYGLTFLSGCANAFDAPARQSLVPGLVPREHLARALSLNITTFQIASIAGPWLGGVLLGKGSIALAYSLDAASFLAVIFSLAVMKHRHIPASGSRVSLGAALEGLRFMRSQEILLWMMALDFAGTFLAGATLLMPIFASEILKVGEEGLGLLYAAPAAGAVLMAAAMSTLPPIKHPGRVILVSVALYGLSISVFGLSESFPLSLACLAISGAADTVSMVLRQTARQTLTPDALRGRMTSVNMIFFMGGPQLGEVEAGAVAKLLGAPLSVATGGLAAALVALGVAIASPALRRYRSD